MTEQQVPKMTHEELQAVADAWADGADVQFLLRGEWRDYRRTADALTIFPGEQWRVKPKDN